MKLSFSTRGWWQEGWDELVSTATEIQFQGIEIYNVLRHPELIGKGGPFHKYNVVATGRELRNKGLSIPVFDTDCDLATAEGAAELRRCIDIAGDMSVPYVAADCKRDDMDTIYANIEALIPFAEEKGVTILIKTRGIFCSTERLRDLMNHFASDQLAALWDVHHSYRDAGETPSVTITNLGAYVKHVHLRDSDDADTYNLIGEGSYPVADLMRALYSVDYDGYISLMWKTEWMEDLPEREVIFPHFVNYMSRFESTRGAKRGFYLNHDGTGEYIWKKDELLNYTFPQVLDAVVDAFPDQFCFKYTTLNYTRTYSQFRDDVDNFARALISLGVKPGAKVAVWCTNVPAWFISFWATVKIGAVLVTVNTAYKIHEIEYLLRQSDTHTLVTIEYAQDSNYREIINELCPEIAQSKPGQPLHCKRLPFLRNVITV
ncbi:MAG: AMP-binding protein, partial [Oscillospiraceae bacterium]|nr:AMP-binding protein [Oscillospiraceae bacterium]